MLKYKTIEMSDPRGKPKVYFSCHPADFRQAFEMLSEDIFRHSNCAVWYDETLSDGTGQQMKTEESTDVTAEQEAFDEMRLFVFAVTSRFLNEPNKAKDQDLPYALEHQIPVLPILLETGLEYRFNEVCAEVQVVNRYVSDPTGTPYEEVLGTFLQSVLVGDELAEKVRNAFDAYVFLSYRKKDRRHAQRLMHLIHENRQFRDIAIWYDEYLIPGEGFNEAIRDVFEKSSLFALAVTPHLLEPENYVMEVEYPLARDRKKAQEGFEIVPVEMYEIDKGDPKTDREQLKEEYQEIPAVQDEHKKPELDAAFLEALEKISKKENDGSATHRFFIGLAYQCGIDVETDHARAVSLLTSAAEDEEPCMDATQKLADMYLAGDGVERNADEAIRWQKKLVGQAQAAFQKCSDPDEHKGYGTICFKAQRKLSDMYRDSGNAEAAIQSAKEALAFSSELEQEVGIREMERDKALTLNRLGSLYRETGDLVSAEDCFTKACRIYEKQAAEIGTQRVRRDLSISYERLGDICRKLDRLAEAEDYYRKARDIRETLQEAAPSVQSRRDLSSVLTKLGNVQKSKKAYAEAGKYYNEALEMDRVLAEEVKSPQAWDDYGVSLVKAGDIHKAEDRMAEAVCCYEKACGIFRQNEANTGSYLFRDHLAGGCEKLASAKKKTGDPETAGSLYEEAVSLREQIYETGRTTANAHALATACYNAAAFFKDRSRMRKAYEIWEELSRKHPAYGKYRDKAASKL